MVEEPLPLDVLDRLTRDVGDRADAIAALLLVRRRSGIANFLGDRLLRCVIHAARGDAQRVQQLLDLEQQDYRDVIVAGEYEKGRPVRDLRASFLIDSPDKFWAAELASMMASRGYRLTVLETRPATAGQFNYMSDYAEGRATSNGPKGDIVIEKKDRQWTIQGNRRQLETHELSHPFSGSAPSAMRCPATCSPGRRSQALPPADEGYSS